MKAKGYMGKVLQIDVGNRRIEQRPLSDLVAEKYIGGSGLGAKFLYDGTKPETKALDPENPLIFAVGPLTGTQIYNSNRFEVIAKSPLTGIYGESNCGGHWGESFKKCGYDALLITGKADRPITISLSNDQITMDEATSLWGKETFETDLILKKQYGDSAQVACIGPAGENLVKFANITTDGTHARSVGRCGLGAVMGSKNIKAIVVRGDKEIELADPDKVHALIKKLGSPMAEFRKTLGAYGTSGGMEMCEEIGNIPVKNWFQGPFPEGAKKISGQRMAATILTNNYHCGRCVLNCGRVVRAVDGPYAGEDIGGPEYETIALFGSNLLIDDLPAIAKSNELCNRLGLDTISTGGVIGFAMEAYQRGLISKKDTGGIELTWGNQAAVFSMIEMIASRKGFGSVLAEGVRAAAEQIGGIAPEFALHVKGLEPPAHDPRAKMTVALGFATSNRGACHLQAFTHDFEEGASIPDLGSEQLIDRFTPDGKAENVYLMQNLMSMFDSLVCCKFVLFGGMTVEPLTQLLNHVTGWDLSTDDFLKTGDRIFTLKRMYNVRLGISRKDDTLPLRMLTHNRGGGTNALPPLGRMLNEYYLYRGWDEFGIPKIEKLRELKIDK
jgi:aldehyde:ferredoxin oxidoreductase